MSNIIDSIQLSGTTYQIQGSGGGVPESAFTAYTAATDARIAEDEEVTAAALNELNEAISGVSGNNVVELTQAEYDALVTGGTVDPTAFYIITDATAGDLTQYWTSAQTQSAITSAVSTKQDTLVSGTNIKTINNESILGSGNIDIQGGGKAIEAGRGIAITTGATADTVSFDLPISAGTGTRSIIEGNAYNKANGESAHAEGYRTSASTYAHSEGNQTKATGSSSHAEGTNTIASNSSEHASGRYNFSNKASTTFGDSGNTLFSVGNGTADNARHNAFEIRQNGDIYLSLNGQDVKLQDQLGGGEVSSAITSGDTNAVAGGAVYDKFDEVEQVTAAGLNAVNSALGGLKLQQITQSAYDSLTTKDPSTLYIIVN